jgi:hypothetical protein
MNYGQGIPSKQDELGNTMYHGIKDYMNGSGEDERW